MVWGDQRRVPAALSAAVTMGITTAWPNAAAAHATGQSFVALLPTGPYMAVGVATVALSIMLLWFLPQRSASALLPHRNIGRVAAAPALRNLSSLLMFLALCGGIATGLNGTRDPLENGLVPASGLRSGWRYQWFKDICSTCGDGCRHGDGRFSPLVRLPRGRFCRCPGMSVSGLQCCCCWRFQPSRLPIRHLMIRRVLPR